jgi:RNA polymerase sigma factor (sigma-70 family)
LGLVLIDIKGIKKPTDLKNLGSYDTAFNDAHLRIITKTFSPQNLFNFLFPDFQGGDDPIIPGWKYFSYPNKWEGEAGKELAIKASRWVLKKEGAIKDDGTIDLNILKDKNWSSVFYKEEYGLGGMLVSCPFTKNIFEAIKLAIPEAIGFKENQIKPWEVTYMHMWQIKDSEGKMLVDHVTKYLIEEHLPKELRVNLLKENGRLNAKKSLEINWGRLYYKVCPSALVNSSLKAHEAIQRVYADSFGYEDDQIKPHELRWENKWEGEAGKKLFTKGFLYSLAKDGLGEIDFTAGVKVTFTKEKLISRLKEGRPDLQKIITDNGLMSGFRKFYNGNLNAAITDIFSAPKEIEKTRDIIKYLQAIIEHNKGRVEIVLEAKYKAKDIYKITEQALKGGSKEKKEATKILLPLAKGVTPESKLAQDAIVTINESLIFDVIKKYFPFINDLDESKRADFIQEGREALWRSISSLDEKEGEFSTHAFWKIRGRISSLLRRENVNDKHFKASSQFDRADQDSLIEGSIEDTVEDASEDNYRELRKKIEGGIKLLEKEREQLKNTPGCASQEEALNKQIIALRLRLFEDKSFREIASVFGKPGKQRCARLPFLRGLERLLPLIGVTSQEDVSRYYSTYTK